MEEQSTMKTIEEVPEESIQAELMQDTVVNLPNLSQRDALSLRNFINKFTPMGWKVVVDLPFLPNSNSALFAVVNTPISPPLQPLDEENWILIKNGLRNVLFDPVDGIPEAPAGQYVGIAQIPPGISITQYQEPNWLSLLSSNHRYWEGGINYQIRVVSNFITQGYITYTKLRNVPRTYGIYDQYRYAPILHKRDWSALAGQQNSYARTDLSMFRHAEITSPWEYSIPYDQQINGFLKTIGQKDLNSITEFQSFDDLIMVYPGSPITSGEAGTQIEFILENCAAPDFNLYEPYPLMANLFMPNSRLVDAAGNPTANVKENFVIPDVMPNSKLFSNGVNEILLTPPK